jgi:hypothetical protein
MDEECDYDHTWIDDSSTQGGDKENCHVGEDNSNMCKDVAIETELMQSQVENDLHGDMELQTELQHALNVLIDEHENVEILSQSNVKFIMAYVEVRESRIFKSTLVLLFQLNGNTTFS